MQRVKLQTESVGYFRRRPVEFFSSGCRLLDCVLGGGWALGRVANIVGDKSTGKTLLAIEAAANFADQHPNGLIWYNEVEAAFDAEYAARLGLPLHRTEFVENCTTVEDLFQDLEDRLSSIGTRPGLYILDSLDALSDKAEMAAKIDKGTYGVGKAKMMSQMFRRLIQRLAESRVTVMLISQVRANIGITFGSSITRSGGRALDFYASQVIYLAQIKALTKTIRKVERSVGIRIRIRCKKNKVGPPFRECEVPLLFFYGLDDVTAHVVWLAEIGQLHLLDLGSDLKVVVRAIKKMDPAAGDLLRSRLSDIVAAEWARIETSFVPGRPKYGRGG